MTKSDAGEARKTTAPASSSGSPQRPAGTRARSQASNSGVLLEHLVQVGAEVPRRDPVRLDPVPRPLGAHRARQHLQPALRRRVRARRRPRELAHHRADVDDLAAAALDHPRRDRPSDEEGARQVDVEHAPPLVELELDERAAERDPRVVDEDVDRAERLHGPSNGSLVRDVERRRDRAFDLGNDRLDGFRGPPVDRDARPRFARAPGRGRARSRGSTR